MVGDENPPEKWKSRYLEANETPKIAEENQSEAFESVSADLIECAARWLTIHRAEIVGPVIPVLKDRFGLKNLGAIEVTKRAHAVCGSMKAAPLLAVELSVRFRTFDEMLTGCREGLETWFANSVMWLAESGQQDVRVFVAGISETVGPAGFYFDSTEGGAGFGMIDGEVMSPLPDDGEFDRLHSIGCEPGEDYEPSGFHPLRHGIPLMEAQRRMKIAALGIAGGEPLSIVGGHVLLTEIERHGISQRIVHRWADIAGQPIRPEPFVAPTPRAGRNDRRLVAKAKRFV